MSSQNPAPEAMGDILLRPLPSTQRGRRTRQQLMDAAARVLVEQGFLETKITDITKAAGTSNGSFYTYFDSKEEILLSLLAEVLDELTDAVTTNRGHGTVLERIRTGNRMYMHTYRRHAGLIGLLEQVATFDPQFLEIRLRVRDAARGRTEGWLRRLAEDGRIDRDLSPRCAAEALTSMVSNFCYVTFVLGDEYPEDEAVDTLSTIWARGIGLVES